MKHINIILLTIFSILGYAACVDAASTRYFNDYRYGYSYNQNNIPITVPANLSNFWHNAFHDNGMIDLNLRDHFSGLTLQLIREMHPNEPLVIALVPHHNYLNQNDFNTYEAHQFNRSLLAFPYGSDISGPDNEIIRDIYGNEVCYFILHPGASSFIFFASFSDVLEQPEKRRYLQSYNHENFNYESFTDLSNGRVETFDGVQLEYGVHRKPPFSTYAKIIAITAATSFLHGLLNNWLGRRAHENNTWFLKAPAREWGTAFLHYFTWSLLNSIFTIKSNSQDNFYATGNLSRLIWSNLLTASAAQMLGEIIPLPGYPGRRALAVNSKLALPFLYQLLFVPHFT